MLRALSAGKGRCADILCLDLLLAEEEGPKQDLSQTVCCFVGHLLMHMQLESRAPGYWLVHNVVPPIGLQIPLAPWVILNDISHPPICHCASHKSRDGSYIVDIIQGDHKRR